MLILFNERPLNEINIPNRIERGKGESKRVPDAKCHDTHSHSTSTAKYTTKTKERDVRGNDTRFTGNFLIFNFCMHACLVGEV